jgi:hypothetical protein
LSDENLLAKAVELFNRKLYFECHDLLEDAWAGARGPERDFLQALIHVAVGMYHVAAGNQKGAVSQLEQGVRALQPFRPDREGLDVEILIIGAARCLEKFENDAIPDWVAEDVPRMNYRRLV